MEPIDHAVLKLIASSSMRAQKALPAARKQ
jgi:hypothetical protein